MGQKGEIEKSLGQKGRFSLLKRSELRLRASVSLESCAMCKEEAKHTGRSRAGGSWATVQAKEAVAGSAWQLHYSRLSLS